MHEPDLVFHDASINGFTPLLAAHYRVDALCVPVMCDTLTVAAHSLLQQEDRNERGQATLETSRASIRATCIIIGLLYGR